MWRFPFSDTHRTSYRVARRPATTNATTTSSAAVATPTVKSKPTRKRSRAATATEADEAAMDDEDAPAVAATNEDSADADGSRTRTKFEPAVSSTTAAAAAASSSSMLIDSSTPIAAAAAAMPITSSTVNCAIHLLRPVEMQSVMLMLDLPSLFRLARCSRQLRSDARADLPWKGRPLVKVRFNGTARIQKSLLSHAGIAVDWIARYATRPSKQLDMLRDQRVVELTFGDDFRSDVFYHSTQAEYDRAMSHPALKHLQKLTLGCAHAAPGKGIAAPIAPLPALTSLTSLIIPRYSAKNLTGLAACASLRKIDLTGPTTEQIRGIAECTQIEELTLRAHMNTWLWHQQADSFETIFVDLDYLFNQSKFGSSLKNLTLSNFNQSSAELFTGFKVDGLRSWTALRSLELDNLSASITQPILRAIVEAMSDGTEGHCMRLQQLRVNEMTSRYTIIWNVPVALAAQWPYVSDLQKLPTSVQLDLNISYPWGWRVGSPTYTTLLPNHTVRDQQDARMQQPA